MLADLVCSGPHTGLYFVCKSPLPDIAPSWCGRITPADFQPCITWRLLCLASSCRAAPGRWRAQIPSARKMPEMTCLCTKIREYPYNFIRSFQKVRKDCGRANPLSMRFPQSPQFPQWKYRHPEGTPRIGPRFFARLTVNFRSWRCAWRSMAAGLWVLGGPL